MELSPLLHSKPPPIQPISIHSLVATKKWIWLVRILCWTHEILISWFWCGVVSSRTAYAIPLEYSFLFSLVHCQALHTLMRGFLFNVESAPNLLRGRIIGIRHCAQNFFVYSKSDTSWINENRIKHQIDRAWQRDRERQRDSVHDLDDKQQTNSQKHNHIPWNLYERVKIYDFNSRRRKKRTK